MNDPIPEEVAVTLRDVYNKVEDLEDAFQKHALDVAFAFGKRPTRYEVMSVVAGGVASVGVLFTIVRFI